MYCRRRYERKGRKKNSEVYVAPQKHDAPPSLRVGTLHETGKHRGDEAANLDKLVEPREE